MSHRSFTRPVLVIVRGAIAFLFLVVIPWNPPSAQTCADEQGSWNPDLNPTSTPIVYLWNPYITGVCSNSVESEISHAAVLPTGPFRGSVLIWRKEIQEEGPDMCDRLCAQNTSVVWLIESSDPDRPRKVEWQLSSDLFCAGQSFDEFGQLVVAGGVPEACDGDPEVTFPGETYRFRPNKLNGYSFLPPPNSNLPPVIGFSGAPWKTEGQMVIGRYYPTVIPLIKKATEFSTNHVPTAGGTIESAVNLVAGGPPRTTGAVGNEFWEVLKSSVSTQSVAWEHPFVPEDPDSPGTVHVESAHFNSINPAAYDLYKLLPSSAPAEHVFDTYPRMFQMNGGHILVCGDVDIGANSGANAPGLTWVVRPDYIGGSLSEWQLEDGPIGTPATGSSLWHDSYYDSPVLLQRVEANGKSSYRVLMFGGSRNVGTSTSNWIVNDTVWEFTPNTNSPGTPLTTGQWTEKLVGIPPNFVPAGEEFPAFERLFGNAVILPTGQIFFVGGNSLDNGRAGHNNGPSDPLATARVAPIIYDPGADEFDSGIVYKQPEQQRARLYHSVAVLTPDGNVLVAGGKKQLDSNGAAIGGNPKFSGEIFYPPYQNLVANGFGSRPVIDEAPNLIDILPQTPVTFSVAATRHKDRIIEKVVLLRPAAITHHWDNDQRYLDLFFTTTLASQNGDEETDALTVTAPKEGDAPPGYYMLFVIEAEAGCTKQGHDVPSVARWVRLK